MTIFDNYEVWFVIGSQHLPWGDGESPGDLKQLLPCLCIIDPQRDLRVGWSQRFSQCNALHAGCCAAFQDRPLHPGRHCYFQCTALCRALQIFHTQPALRVEIRCFRQRGIQRKIHFQRFFIAFQLGQRIFRKGRDGYPGRQVPAAILECQLSRTKRGKTGQHFCPGIRQRTGAFEGSRCTQRADDPLG